MKHNGIEDENDNEIKEEGKKESSKVIDFDLQKFILTNKSNE